MTPGIFTLQWLVDSDTKSSTECVTCRIARLLTIYLFTYVYSLADRLFTYFYLLPYLLTYFLFVRCLPTY